MTDQTTPRTDAIANDEDGLPHKIVRFASLARSLEREAAELRAAIRSAEDELARRNVDPNSAIDAALAALAKAGA